jgi:hypothetical protein
MAPLCLLSVVRGHACSLCIFVFDAISDTAQLFLICTRTESNIAFKVERRLHEREREDNRQKNRSPCPGGRADGGRKEDKKCLARIGLSFFRSLSFSACFRFVHCPKQSFVNRVSRDTVTSCTHLLACSKFAS